MGLMAPSGFFSFTVCVHLGNACRETGHLLGIGSDETLLPVAHELRLYFIQSKIVISPYN